MRRRFEAETPKMGGSVPQPPPGVALSPPLLAPSARKWATHLDLKSRRYTARPRSQIDLRGKRGDRGPDTVRQRQGRRKGGARSPLPPPPHPTGRPTAQPPREPYESNALLAPRNGPVRAIRGHMRRRFEAETPKMGGSVPQPPPGMALYPPLLAPRPKMGHAPRPKVAAVHGAAPLTNRSEGKKRG